MILSLKFGQCSQLSDGTVSLLNIAQSCDSVRTHSPHSPEVARTWNPTGRHEAVHEGWDWPLKLGKFRSKDSKDVFCPGTSWNILERSNHVSRWRMLETARVPEMI